MGNSEQRQNDRYTEAFDIDNHEIKKKPCCLDFFSKN